MIIKSLKKDKLQVWVVKDRATLGAEAARQVSECFRELLLAAPFINVIFAAAPSQNEFLEALVNDPTIAWQRINAFHMDEYIGLSRDAPQLFSKFLRDKLFARVPFHSVHYMMDNHEGIAEVCAKYVRLLQEHPPDLVCMGIGENGHIAFNDPPVANFSDPEIIKAVKLDHYCRRQQVNDGCFASLNEVPTEAVTLTIPTIMSAKYLYCMVPGKTKAEAISQTLNDPLSTKCPATILRTHDRAVLFVDEESFGNPLK